MSVQYNQKDIVYTVLDNIKQLYTQRKGKEPEEVNGWIDKIRERIYSMIDDPFSALEYTESHLEDLKAHGVELGKFYDIDVFSREQAKKILTAVYVLTIYARAHNPDDPEWEIDITETAFSIQEKNA